MKVRMNINLTAEQRKILDDHYIAGIENGNKKSYSELIGEMIEYYCKE